MEFHTAYQLKQYLVKLIQAKLDDSILETLCGQYARNYKLRLTAPDVQFLQPPHSRPSHVFQIRLPHWVDEPKALLFYYLQTLSSSVCLKPRYMSGVSREQFQLPQVLENAYVSSGVSLDLKQDHIFLYIRPHTQGRGEFGVCFFVCFLFFVFLLE